MAYIIYIKLLLFESDITGVNSGGKSSTHSIITVLSRTQYVKWNSPFMLTKSNATYNSPAGKLGTVVRAPCVRAHIGHVQLNNFATAE